MNTIDYMVSFWQTRKKIADLGVRNPVQEMINLGLIKDSPKNTNLLLGRAKENEFLYWLKVYAESIDYSRVLLSNYGSAIEAIESLKEDLLTETDMFEISTNKLTLKILQDESK